MHEVYSATEVGEQGLLSLARFELSNGFSELIMNLIPGRDKLDSE
jgi:hypothetical protein